jgi:GT2 family glycosyltransferase
MNVFGMVTTAASAAYTPHALASFFQNTPLQAGDLFFLIDNDGAWSPAQPPNPAITLIRNPSPRSFAANVNQVMRLAADKDADLFFLNNDIIFTPHWFDPLLDQRRAILTPASNFIIEYRHSNFTFTKMLDLGDYLAHEATLTEIAQMHRQRNRGFIPVNTINFFCVKIPHAVYQQLGPLDERFGVGGGEDVDYCLRCHLAGVAVEYAAASFVLHFMGKSTWRGPESAEQSRQRDEQYRHAFREKWGQTLYDLTLGGNESVLDSRPGLREAYSRKDYQTVIEQLRPGS